MVLSLSQIEETLGHTVTLGFPPASEQAYHAAMSSIPLYMVQPDGLVAQQFMKLADLLAQRVQKAGR